MVFIFFFRGQKKSSTTTKIHYIGHKIFIENSAFTYVKDGIKEKAQNKHLQQQAQKQKNKFISINFWHRSQTQIHCMQLSLLNKNRIPNRNRNRNWNEIKISWSDAVHNFWFLIIIRWKLCIWIDLGGFLLVLTLQPPFGGDSQ